MLQLFFLKNQNKNSAQSYSLHIKNQFVLIGTIVFVTCLLYARDLYGLDISKYDLVMAAIIPAVFMSHASIIYLTLYLLPLTSGLPGKIILPILMLLIFIKKPMAVNENGIMCFILIAFLELIHFGFYTFPIQISSTIGYLTTIFFLCYIATLKDSTVNNSKCVFFFIVGLLAFFFAIWYITQINHNIEMLLESGERIGNTKRVTGVEESVMMLNANPNNIGSLSLTGTSLVLTLYYMHKLQFWPMAFLVTVFVYLGALSVSRTWLIGMIFLILLLFITIRHLNAKNARTQYLILLLLIVISVFSFSQNELLYNSFSARFAESDTSTLGARTTLIREYNQVLINNPSYFFFGVGAVHYKNVITEIYLSIHNGTQQILVAYGIIGLFLFLLLTIKAVKRNYRKGGMICMVSFIISLFYVQSGQLLNPPSELHVFIISFVAMRLIDDENLAPKDI